MHRHKHIYMHPRAQIHRRGLKTPIHRHIQEHRHGSVSLGVPVDMRLLVSASLGVYLHLWGCRHIQRRRPTGTPKDADPRAHQRALAVPNPSAQFNTQLLRKRQRFRPMSKWGQTR